MAEAKGAAVSPMLGLVLALVGLAWLGGNLGIEPSRVLGALWPWPLILLIFGVAVLIGRQQHSVTRGLALIVTAMVVWASRERLVPVPFWHVVAPTLLAVAGSVMVWRYFNQPAK
jgi:hypothetical protein